MKFHPFDTGTGIVAVPVKNGQGFTRLSEYRIYRTMSNGSDMVGLVKDDSGRLRYISLTQWCESIDFCWYVKRTNNP